MKILTVVGARPQFMKAAVVSRALQTTARDAQEFIVHTGQHYDHNLSGVFFEELRLPHPYRHLNAVNASHNVTMGKMFEGVEETIRDVSPDWVLVYGDTNSTVAGALAARVTNTRLIHIEAGLRSFNRQMPEELNRITTDHISDLLFAPSETAMRNLAAEHVTGAAHMVGDVMFDSLLHQAALAPSEAPLAPAAEYAFMTCHRAENTDDPARLHALFAAIGRVPLPVLCPLHPRTAKAMEVNAVTPPDNLTLVDPMSFTDLISHVRAARLVLTDSGGLQKEAFFLEKPCIILRQETEWTELLDTGASLLAGNDFDGVPAQAAALLEGSFTFAPIYGDGTAGRKIVDILSAAG